MNGGRESFADERAARSHDAETHAASVPSGFTFKVGQTIEVRADGASLSIIVSEANFRT